MGKQLSFFGYEVEGDDGGRLRVMVIPSDSIEISICNQAHKCLAFRLSKQEAETVGQYFLQVNPKRRTSWMNTASSLGSQSGSG